MELHGSCEVLAFVDTPIVPRKHRDCHLVIYQLCRYGSVRAVKYFSTYGLCPWLTVFQQRLRGIVTDMLQSGGLP